MTPLERLKDVLDKPPLNDENSALIITCLPPLADSEIAALEASLPCVLPSEIRELLAFCSGFDGPLDRVDFTGKNSGYDQEDVFPFGRTLAADGFGNYWIIDLLPTSTTFGPIYFYCHDPAVILYQSPDLEHFLTELFKPKMGLIDKVHEDELFEVWFENPGVQSFEACEASEDAELKAFAQEIGPTFQIIDLRNARIGMGFSWGRYASDPILKRHGHFPIFAYERKEKVSLWNRLFGRPKG